MTEVHDPIDVLAVMAHPDDAELLCGGTLIRCADEGLRTAVLDLTRGEFGSSGNEDSRAAEAERAAATMGLAYRASAELPDAGLANDDESRVVVAGWLRRLRPRVVITHWPVARHPDHRAAAELTRDASFMAGLENLQAEGDPHRPHSVVHALTFHDDAPLPTFVVDITAQMERKIETLRCYPSQFDGRIGFGGVHGGGDRLLYDQVRIHAARDGARIRRAYGEPFWVRETLEMPVSFDSLVSTF